MNKIFARIVAIAASLFSASCVSLLPETAPPKPRYHISAADASALQGAPLGWSLVVDDPHTTRVYDSARIAVSTGPGKIEYLAGGEWADRGPRLVQAALVETFQDSGRILAVGDRSAVPIGDIVLQTDIRAMHLDAHHGDPVSTVVIYARLSDGKGGVYAARRFDAAAPARSVRADDVVAAFDAAFTAAISELVAWTYAEGDRAVSSGS